MIKFTEFYGEFSIYTDEELAHSIEAIKSIRYLINTFEHTVPDDSNAILLIIREYYLASSGILNRFSTISQWIRDGNKIHAIAAGEYQWEVMNFIHVFCVTHELLERESSNSIAESVLYGIDKIISDYKNEPIIKGIYNEIFANK